MRVLAIDQARHGGWAIYDDDSLDTAGVWNFDSKDYTFERAVLQIERTVFTLIAKYDIDYLIYEDIQMQRSTKAFKRLAQLQGVLINLAVYSEIPYTIVHPKTWQAYRDKTFPELKGLENKKRSIAAVKELFDIETENDNLADAICIGYYAANNLSLSLTDANA